MPDDKKTTSGCDCNDSTTYAYTVHEPEEIDGGIPFCQTAAVFMDSLLMDSDSFSDLDEIAERAVDAVEALERALQARGRL